MDYELRTRLTADGSELTAAMRQAGRETIEYAQALQNSTRAEANGMVAQREAAAALQAAAAARDSFIKGLRDQVAVYGKSTEAVLRYRAAQAGAAEEAAPLILQLQNIRAAHEQAAQAAQKEAAAQREADQAKKSSIAAQEAFLANLRDQIALQGKSGSEVLQYRADQLGVGSQAEVYIQQLREYEKNLGKAGVTAGQTAAAMRMLPAQITDITTSLVSGMPIWMVAIQQGGQIKDSFGGIGPMFTALAASINPVVVGIAAVAAVAGVMIAAYAQGSAEADNYSRAIIMSGNAAGTTVGRLNEMAKAISTVAGTQHQAASALAAMTATGQVSNANLQEFTTTAVRMQRIVGQSVEDTAKSFEDLGRKPLESSVRLNQQYGYLTTATYDRIKALEQQKRMDEAGDVAQKAFSEAMQERASRLEKNLGTIERGWKAVKDGAASAWDAMLNLGRKQTTEEQLMSVGAQLAALDSRKSTNPAITQKRRETLQQRQAELQEQLRLERRAAEAEAAERSKTDKHIIKSEEYDQTRGAVQAAQLAAIKSSLSALTGAYGDAERILDTQRQAGLISESEYWEAKRGFIKLNEQAEAQALARENQVLAAQKVFGAEQIQRDSQIAQNKADMARIHAKAGADIVVANAQEAAALEKLRQEYEAFARSFANAQAARARDLGRSVREVGMGDDERDRTRRVDQIDDDLESQRQRLDADRASKRITTAEYNERLAVIEQFHLEALQSEQDYQRQLTAAQEDGSNGMRRAMQNYLVSARDVASQTERMFSSAFQSMEDGVVKFAMTGKLNFHDFAQSVIADLIRIYIRQQMIGFITSMVGAAAGGGSTAGTAVNGSAGTPMIPGNVAHGGGVMGTDSFQRRMAPASAWDHAPRYHSGLKSDEYYAILQREESVLTPAQMRQLRPAGATSAPQVNISMPLNLINNTGTAMKAQTRQRSDGGFDVILEAVEGALAGNVSSGSGPLSRALEGRYGLNPSMSV